MRSDLGHRLTDKELEKLERKIAKVYSEASADLSDTIQDYFEKFKSRDEEMRKLVEDGSWSKQEYKKWRLAQIGRGERFEAMRDKLAEQVTEANERAIDYVNDAMPNVYALNRNYAAYTIEMASDAVDFTLYDEGTVLRLLAENPATMPYYPQKRAINRGIDLAYGQRQITASVTSGIIRGCSIKRIADELQTYITDMSRTSAIRAARTAMTSAQNGGRQASYDAAEKMGIIVQKEWMATKDERTRYEHGMADGQVVNKDDPFTVGGEKLMFPGDSSGSGWNIYNCRCTMRAVIPGSPYKKRETYSEWLDRKAEEGEKQYGVSYGDAVVNSAPDYFSSTEFKSKFDGITGNPSVDAQIYNCAKRAVVDNLGTKYESMFLIDESTGKIISEITGKRYKHEQQINYPAYFRKALDKANKNGTKIIAVHNHPEGFPPSIDDFASANRHKYSKCIVAGANGQVYEYSNKDRRITDQTAEHLQGAIMWNYNSGYDVDRAYLDVYKTVGLSYNIRGR